MSISKDNIWAHMATPPSTPPPRFSTRSGTSLLSSLSSDQNIETSTVKGGGAQPQEEERRSHSLSHHTHGAPCHTLRLPAEEPIHKLNTDQSKKRSGKQPRSLNDHDDDLLGTDQVGPNQRTSASSAVASATFSTPLLPLPPAVTTPPTASAIRLRDGAAHKKLSPVRSVVFDPLTVQREVLKHMEATLLKHVERFYTCLESLKASTRGSVRKGLPRGVDSKDEVDILVKTVTLALPYPSTAAQQLRPPLASLMKFLCRLDHQTLVPVRKVFALSDLLVQQQQQTTRSLGSRIPVISEGSEEEADAKRLVEEQRWAPDVGKVAHTIVMYAREYKGGMCTLLDVFRAAWDGSKTRAATLRGAETGKLQHHGDGRDLLEASQMSQIVWQLCEGLSFLHSAGTIHGNLKPQNVLVTSEGPKVFMTDHGLPMYPIALLDTSVTGAEHAAAARLLNAGYVRVKSVAALLAPLEAERRKKKLIAKGSGYSYHSKREDSAEMTEVEEMKQELIMVGHLIAPECTIIVSHRGVDGGEKECGTSHWQSREGKPREDELWVCEAKRSAASDAYALGIISYLLLVGAFPPLPERTVMLSTDTFLPPSLRGGPSARPFTLGIPEYGEHLATPALVWILSHLLHPHPDERVALKELLRDPYLGQFNERRLLPQRHHDHRTLQKLAATEKQEPVQRVTLGAAMWIALLFVRLKRRLEYIRIKRMLHMHAIYVSAVKNKATTTTTRSSSQQKVPRSSSSVNHTVYAMSKVREERPPRSASATVKDRRASSARVPLARAPSSSSPDPLRYYGVTEGMNTSPRSVLSTRLSDGSHSSATMAMKPPQIAITPFLTCALSASATASERMRVSAEGDHREGSESRTATSATRVPTCFPRLSPSTTDSSSKSSDEFQQTSELQRIG